MLLQLGTPIMVAQLSQTAMGFVDTLMAGHVSARDLAAVALGNGIWLPVFLALSGVLMATTPMTAQHLGAGNRRAAGAVFQQGFWVALLAGSLAFVSVRNCGWLLEQLNVAPELATLTQAYLRAISWGLPAILLYQLIRSFCEGFGLTRVVMKIGVLGLLCNIPLNYIFIYGKLGLPAMGGVGCGWATSIVMCIMLLAGGFYIWRSPAFTEAAPLGQWQRPSLQATRQFLQLGFPIGVSLLIEVSMFSLIALLLAPRGDITVAAHQITMSFTGLTFMLPLSIALAITIRVGHLTGAKDYPLARRSAFTGVLLALGCALLSCSFMLIFAHNIASLYSPNPVVITLAAQLLTIAAFFQFSDSIQVAAAGALRGYKDTSIPLLLVFVAYWLIGMPAGYVLGLTDWLGPAQGAHGFWYGLVLGLSLGAFLLGTRLLRMTRRYTASLAPA
ncbi:MATE family efflux transporter [Marinobacterium rhizophilum]|uniref:MATE family efflux transporter n=1 Tax=Marinobacterium rhizophilum TaxID=420402 RepID=UPI000360AE6C|nr:MATE family efflux transporter [Marinobacterium rhizophilum]